MTAILLAAGIAMLVALVAWSSARTARDARTRRVEFDTITHSLKTRGNADERERQRLASSWEIGDWPHVRSSLEQIARPPLPDEQQVRRFLTQYAEIRARRQLARGAQLVLFGVLLLVCGVRWYLARRADDAERAIPFAERAWPAGDPRAAAVPVRSVTVQQAAQEIANVGLHPRVIVFYDASCDCTHQMMRALAVFREAHAAEGLVILGYSINRDVNDARIARVELHPPFPAVWLRKWTPDEFIAAMRDVNIEIPEHVPPAVVATLSSRGTLLEQFEEPPDTADIIMAFAKGGGIR